MQRPKGILVYSIWAILGLSPLAGSLFVLSDDWPESQYMVEGDSRIRTLIPKEIRNVPKIRITGSALYHSSCGDGPKPPSFGLEYLSLADTDVIHATIDNHLLNHGFSRTPGPPMIGKLAYHKSRQRVFVDTETVPGKPVCVRVDEFLE